MSPGAFAPNDPAWTAYALGEVSPKEKEGMDAALRFSSDAGAEVEQVRLAAQNLREAWVAEKVEVIPLEPAAFVDGVMGEAGIGGAGGANPALFRIGSLSLPVSPKYVVLGFAVIVAAAGGGLTWEMEQQPRPAMLRWIPALGSQPETEALTPVQPPGEVTTTMEAVPPTPVTPPPALGDNAFDVRQPDAASAPAPAPAPAPATAQQTAPTPAPAAPALTPASPPPAAAPAAASVAASSAAAAAAAEADAARAARKERIDRLRDQLAAEAPPATPAAPSSSAPSAFPDTISSVPIQTETEIPLASTQPGGIAFVPGPLRVVRQPIQTGFALAEIVPVLPVALLPRERAADGSYLEEGNGIRLVDYGADNDAQTVPAQLPFVMMARLFPSPWAEGRQLLVVGLRATTPAQVARPPANLVFLVDNSLSMGAPDRLGAFKKAVLPFLERLHPGDRVGIVTYAGSSAIPLPLTEIPKKRDEAKTGAAAASLVSAPGADAAASASEDEARATIRSAFSRLAVATADRPGASLRAAFDMAKKGFVPDGFNRVIVVTDNDLDSLAYGQKGEGGMTGEITRQAREGVTLSVMFLGKEAADGPMLRKVVAAGRGRGSVLRTAGGVETVLEREVASPRPASVKDVRLQLALAPESVGAWRLIGYENRLPVTGNGIAPKEGDGLLAFYELQRPVAAAPVDLTARFRRDGSEGGGKEILHLAGLAPATASQEVSPQLLREFDRSAAEVRDRLAALSPDTRAGGVKSPSAETVPNSVPSAGSDSAEAYKNFRQNTEEWLDAGKKN
ncbi:von Willebrand factor type A domain-containing protein [Verrucomicrobium sp. GAS474]|uniref:vWA domain-containing protein n=1 Tax=Verrucomicrobium sp. GAS474 TaxID=1882831 RepID=UPI00087C9E17|nr:VWA domain-containing protein [Verrucomicrobium sp. GAS474]SDU01428.1 von Willebrand factor type A domain-containing protein [Verrucomicrobium sp. GAS474]